MVFYDKNGRVVAVHHNVKPWRITKIHTSAKGVLELPAESAKGIRVGDKLLIHKEATNVVE